MTPKKFYTQHIYNIGFVQNTLDDVLQTHNPLNVEYMKHNYTDRWFADPFILDVDDDYIYLLVEEFPFDTNIGKISKLTVKKSDYTLEKIDSVLELDTHLSFPAILRRNEKVYIYPENSVSGVLNLYEYNPDNNICQYTKTLCNQPLTDAIITNIMGGELIMSTVDSSIPINKKTLRCYDGDNIIQEFNMMTCVARNAGDWFEYNGQWYRPAQDNNISYGAVVILQKVFKVNDTLEFSNIRRLISTHPILNKGCHTFNHYKNVIVIDVKGDK